MYVTLHIVTPENLLEIWMKKWDPELHDDLQLRFLDNKYAKWIVGQTRVGKWTDREVEAAVQRQKKLKDIYRYLSESHRPKNPPKKNRRKKNPPKKNPPDWGPPQSSGSRKPRKPKPSSGSGSAAKRNRRKKQFENNDQYYSDSFGHRPRGRPTPMSGETCNSCGSPIRWDGNCNCS